MSMTFFTLLPFRVLDKIKVTICLCKSCPMKKGESQMSEAFVLTVFRLMYIKFTLQLNLYCSEVLLNCQGIPKGSRDQE